MEQSSKYACAAPFSADPVPTSLASALLATGFNEDEARKILGGNYARVFTATVG